MKIGKLQTRGEFRPASFDAEKRTIDLVWTTGAKGLRETFWGDRYYEELQVDAQACHLDRLNAGAPLLNAHDADTLSDVIGVVERAWIENGTGLATVRFSEREDVAAIVQDVAAGILRNVSVGYLVNVYEKSEPADSIPTYRAVDWTPMELSLVPIPFDAAAQTRKQSDVYEAEIRSSVPITPAAESGTTDKKERSMKTCPDCGAQVEDGLETCPDCGASMTAERKAPNVNTRAIADIAAKLERTRITEIRKAVKSGGLSDEMSEQLINDGTPLEAARAMVIEKLAERDAQIQTRSVNVQVTRDQGETMARAMSSAITIRANPRARFSTNEAEQRQAIEEARDFRGLTLIDMARESIERAGGNARGMSRREIAQAAMNLDRGVMTRAGMATSDFPNVLASTVNRTLRQAYSLAPRTFVDWCRQATAPDFRQVARVQLSELTKMEKINESGEYKRLYMGDSSEKYSLGKYGGIVAITWESIINDDLSAFDRIPYAIAEEAAATEGDIVYSILSANAAMADTVALFHANHGNLLAATAIDAIKLGLARAAMRKQTGPQGRILNLTPEFLIVGPDKEGEANQYTSSNFVASSAGNINPAYNTSLTVIVDPRITGTKWYMSASPNRIDTIEYAYLEGEDGLFTEQRQGFDVDGLEIKARHVFAAKAIDWRGLTYNAGA